MKAYKTIDSYIDAYPESVQKKLQQIRRAIHKAAPKAEEAIKYGIPTFVLNGGNLVHFGGFKKHIGFYPAPSGIVKFKTELSKYQSSKGTVQFPFDKPLPITLITKIVKYRVAEQSARSTKRYA